MKTQTEIIAQINSIERDLEIMAPTPGKIAWEYYVKALKWVLGEDLKLIGHFEISDKKSAAEVGER
jgi:hypothetical protein